MSRLFLVLFCLCVGPIQALAEIDSLTVTVVDAFTGDPLIARHPPHVNAGVRIWECPGKTPARECVDAEFPFVGFSAAGDSTGRHRFTGQQTGFSPFVGGRHVVHIFAPDYHVVERIFHIDDGQQLDLGTVELAPPSVILRDLVMCEDSPDRCVFSYRLINTTTKPIPVIAWVSVQALTVGTGSPIVNTVFDLQKRPTFTLPAHGGSRRLRWAPRFPAGAPAFTGSCFHAFASRTDRNGGRHDGVVAESLFCTYKEGAPNS